MSEIKMDKDTKVKKIIKYCLKYPEFEWVIKISSSDSMIEGFDGTIGVKEDVRKMSQKNIRGIYYMISWDTELKDVKRFIDNIYQSMKKAIRG
jgi:hypothetical protein